MKVFVTGSESFIGKELINQCLREGIEVIGVDVASELSAYSSFGDIRDPDIDKLIPENVDAIIHLGGLSRDADCKKQAQKCFDVNVMGTLNLIQAAKKKNAKQFIFASSEWVYDQFDLSGNAKVESDLINIANLTSEYSLSKLVSEVNLKQAFTEGFCSTTILRFGIVYGPRKNNWSAVESMLNSVATKKELTVGSLKTGRHFIHVSDIAAGIRASFGLNGYNIINLQANELITLGNIIEISQELLGKKLEVTESDSKNPSIKPVSNKKAKELIKWSPAISISEGLQSVGHFLNLL